MGIAFSSAADESRVRIERKIVFRILGLHPDHPSIHDLPGHPHGQVLEIDIQPLERQNFADSQPGTLGGDYHRAIGILPMVEQRNVLLDREDDRLFASLADTPNFDQSHRVALQFDHLPQHGLTAN